PSVGSQRSDFQSIKSHLESRVVHGTVMRFIPAVPNPGSKPSPRGGQFPQARSPAMELGGQRPDWVDEATLECSHVLQSRLAHPTNAALRATVFLLVDS